MNNNDYKFFEDLIIDLDRCISSTKQQNSRLQKGFMNNEVEKEIYSNDNVIVLASDIKVRLEQHVRKSI